MVSPSKKRQIKGRVNTGHKIHRKGDKSNNRLPYKPLLNKKFYLDVKGYRNTPTITSDIQTLGGIVEEFFSREINYVISSRVQQQQQAGGSSSEQQPSPSGVQIASPLTPHQPLSSLASTSHDSPLTVDSPREDAGKKRVRTRAEVLLERACVRRPGTSDVLENARLWHVPVWSLAKLLKWLSALKQSERYRPPRTHGTTPAGRTNTTSTQSTLTKVQRLRDPFIKTEPFSRQYKPLYKELSSWPELNLSNPPGVSPFADPKQAKTQPNLRTSSAVRDDHREKRTKERNRGTTRVKEAGGYCELCTANYTNLRLHLRSDSHLAFVRNDTNYLFLDELISGHKQDPQIGETIHSGPSLVAQEASKDEGVGCSSDTVFPGDSQQSTKAILHPSQSDPAKQLSCFATQPPFQEHQQHTTVPLAAVLPEASILQHLVPSIIVTEASDPEDPTPGVAGTQSDFTTPAAHRTTNSVTVREPTESQDSPSQALSPQAVTHGEVVDTTLKDTVPDVCVPASPRGREDQAITAPDKVVDSNITQVILNKTPPQEVKKSTVEGSTTPQEVKDSTVEGNTIQEVKESTVEENTTPKEKEVNVEEASIPQTHTVEVITPDVLLNEATLPEVAQTEAALPELTETKLVTTKEVQVQVVEGEIADTTAVETTQVLQKSFSPSPTLAFQTSLTETEESKEMVRLIQEGDTKLDSFCNKRSSRASKRVNSAEFDHVLELKSEPLSKVKRCTRTRRTSCRSEKSESETSDSRSVADEFDMVDKTAKQGKPKNGEPLLDEATTHLSAKYNGDVNSELVNGAHKVKGRRVSRANSDESDCSSASRSNGNVEHNGDKVDFSVLLEISPADRKKFESKKAKIRRKTADWLLISETEQYYNEKEEIMRNKNKLDSDSESDESDDDTENQDSKSDCSDESESNDKSSRVRNKGKGKQSRTIDEESGTSVKRMKDDACMSRKQGRPIGSRKRKTRYDLTMLNDDDDDDDENFFGFPISTTIPQGSPGVSNLASTGHGRGRGKDGCKRSLDAASCSSSSGKAGRKRLSDAERFLRDNREYYHFQETPERLRRSSSTMGGEKEKPARDDDVTEPEKKEEPKPKEGMTAKKRPTGIAIDTRRRVTRSAGAILEEPEGKEKEKSCQSRNSEKAENKDKEKYSCKTHEEYNRKILDDSKRKCCEEDKEKCCEDSKGKCEENKGKCCEDKGKCCEDKGKYCEDSKGKYCEESIRKCCEENNGKCCEENNGKCEENEGKCCEENKGKMSEEECRKHGDESKKSPDSSKSDSEDSKKDSEEERKISEDKIYSDEDKRKQVETSSKVMLSGNGECSELRGKVSDTIEMNFNAGSELHGLYFSFEGAPEQECWYQTYQRLIDGVSDNVFFYKEDPLKFVLPYEMPKEYVRDFLCYKKCLLSKKKNDLADLVRKSPRCHPSTLALISDIIPTKRTRNVKPMPMKPTVVKIDEASSDGTSTPGAESMRTQPPESFETTEELAILALHIDHIMKSEIGVEEMPVCSHIDECKGEESDLKKTPPKKRGKKKRLLAVSKPEKVMDGSTKEVKLFDSPLAQDVDPVFIAGLCDEMKDFLIPENILAREASEVMDDSFFCVCTDRASCDDFSSADDNTEASSECVSLCDSETIDGSIISEPKRTRSAKKRRKNLTGWPKTQKRKRPAPSHTSDDNDSAIGWDDLEPKKQGCWKKHDNFSLLEQTTSERLAALAACDRRASPRKKASVLYMDTWPVRFRTQK